MGVFRDSIMTSPGWWRDYDHVVSEFYLYVNGKIEDEGSALRLAPETSKERVFYNYLFGMDGVVNQRTDIERGAIKTLIDQTGKKIQHSKTATIDPLRADEQKRLTDEQVHGWMKGMLKQLDYYASQVQARGSLKIKQTMQELIFRGDWQSATDNAIPAAATQMCNPYKLKHFGADNKAAQYINLNRYAVKAMEEKAITHGLSIPGGQMFRFNANVGWDGIGKDHVPNTKAIRVDSIGSEQHSHPLPNEDPKVASVKSYVVGEIIDAARDKDMERLIEIAQFITLCEGSAKEFTPQGKHKAAWKKAQEVGMELPDCKFW